MKKIMFLFILVLTSCNNEDPKCYYNWRKLTSPITDCRSLDGAYYPSLNDCDNGIKTLHNATDFIRICRNE